MQILEFLSNEEQAVLTKIDSGDMVIFKICVEAI